MFVLFSTIIVVDDAVICPEGARRRRKEGKGNFSSENKFRNKRREKLFRSHRDLYGRKRKILLVHESREKP